MKSGLAALSFSERDKQYDEYLRRLDVRRVLDHYGVMNDREEPGSDGTTEIVHSCLLDQVDRHHNNGDQNPSASANADKKLYICHSYWGGDLIHFIQKMEDRHSIADTLPFVAQFLGDATLEADDFKAEWEKLMSDYLAVHNPPPPIPIPSYSDRVMAPWAFTHPYLLERGVTHETASRFRVGWREDDNRIIIPHFWKGNLVGWQARAVPHRPGQWPGTANPQPKYKSTSGFPKSETFFYDHSRPFPDGGTVIVVESPMSVIKAASLGLDIPVLATFGAKVSDTQVQMLTQMRFDRVIIWADPDMAGAGMERKLVDRLHRHSTVTVVNPDQGMDLGDYTDLGTVEAKIDTAVPAVIAMTRRR